MAFSIQRAVSDGTMTLLPISIEYFDREEISVLFDGVLNARQWAWVGTTDKTLSFTPAVGNAVEVVIVRTTDLSQLRHQFSLGAQFTAESLDESLIQVLHIAQEASEQLQGSDFYNDLDLHGYKIANVAPGVNPGDAVNHAQMEVHDATIVGYMNTTEGYKNAAAASAAEAEAAVASITLPLPVSNGGTGATTQAGARSALGLGTAATATLGTGSGQVPTADQIPGLVSQKQIQSISASVSANALTISAGALSLDFRSSTLGSGTVTTVSGTPSSLVISSGSTLGTVSGQQSRVVVLAINNAGTIELAAVNIAGGNALSETDLISTVAEGGAGAADSANVIYSTTARTNVAYRVIGYIESTQATAGTWAAAPSTIQGAGGNALMSMQSLGYGQTWQNVTGSRSGGTTYYNTTGKPITVHVKFVHSSAGVFGTLTIGGIAIDSTYQLSTNPVSLQAVVPPGASYVFSGSYTSIIRWVELR